jgi:hypothetical protein
MNELMQLGGWRSNAMVLRYSHLDASHLAVAAAKMDTFQVQTEKVLA